MEVLKDRYTITELSKRLGITDHALRFYEKEFNLYIPKDSRGRRFYNSDQANIMYRIKVMRSEGLEIKAIRKYLISENVISENVVSKNVITGSTVLKLPEDSGTALVPSIERNDTKEMTVFFEDFGEQIINRVTAEFTNLKDNLTREIIKSKLELGACVENSARKLETKMERHFLDVDRSISSWRDRKKGGLFRKLSRY